MRSEGQRLRLGNESFELTLDRRTGGVLGLVHKRTRTRLVNARVPTLFTLTWSTWGVHGSKPEDLWSAGEGARLSSVGQTLSSFAFRRGEAGGVLELVFDALSLGGQRLDLGVRVQIECKDEQEEMSWRLALDNRAAGIVRDVQFPLLSGIAEAESLLLPNHGGERVGKPGEKLTDATPTIGIEYPSRASMQWLTLTYPSVSLYLASYDESLSYTRFAFGRHDGAHAAWMTKHPFIANGATWQSPPFGVAALAGSWHEGADRYRAWLSSWTQPPEVPARVRTMLGGGGGLYIKDRTEKTVARYEDLVTKAAAVPASIPDPAFMLIGWFRNGHDTFFPEYDAIDELGGARALSDAIAKVQARGGFVTAYMNGRLNNIETKTYKAFGKRWAVLGRAPGLGVGSINFFELHERWNPEWERDQRGEGWFSVMCPSAKGWQDHIVSQAVHVVRDYGFDGIFLDQPGSYYAELCFNPHHGHSTPGTAWGPGQIEIFKRIRTEVKKLKPHFVLYTEGMNDVIGQYLDFHTDKNPLWEPMRVHPQAESFPQMWRYTLPAYITSNGPGAFSYPPARDKVHGPNYRFVLGIRGIGRGFGKNVVASEEDKAQLDQVVSKLERMWRKAGPLLYDARYVDTVGLGLDTEAVFARANIRQGQVAIPLWNVTEAPTEARMTLDGAAWGFAGAPLRARLLDREEEVKLDSKGRFPGKGPEARVQLAPHEVDVLVVDFEP